MVGKPKCQRATLTLVLFILFVIFSSLVVREGRVSYSYDMEYKPTIGLEIHAELKTKTKMFCSCKNDTDEKRPNVNICPICLGHPGTLPVINKEAVKSILKIGIAVGGKLADFSEFDRKNYFYPDIPKGYQISQYKHPLVSWWGTLGS